MVTIRIDLNVNELSNEEFKRLFAEMKAEDERRKERRHNIKSPLTELELSGQLDPQFTYGFGQRAYPPDYEGARMK